MAREVGPDGPAVEQFRSYLLLLARMHLGRQAGNRIDPSDLVQQTLLDAHRECGQGGGREPGQMAAWLRRILACNLADALRALYRGKRDVSRERSLETELAESSGRLEKWLAAEQSSPSQQAMRNEQMFRLADALSALPESQREALVLHYWQEMPLTDVAAQMGRSPASVAGLLQRGLKTLRTFLAERK
jgi:RNA polymerase sigma-70 factor (ECF subfamily)